ncbi:MAG: putative quinol monooxygenase [Pirellulaceae bacterium]
MIHVIATIELTPGSQAAFLKEFHALVPLVHAEAGCLTYGPTVDVACDALPIDSPRADVVTVVESWESVEALQAHLAAPHMLEYREKVKDYVSGTKIQVLEPA